MRGYIVISPHLSAIYVTTDECIEVYRKSMFDISPPFDSREDAEEFMESLNGWRDACNRRSA